MPSLTPAGRRDVLQKALRQVKAAYRKADTAGEVLERQMNRMLQVKKEYTPEAMTTFGEGVQVYRTLVEQLDRASSDFIEYYMDMVG